MSRTKGAQGKHKKEKPIKEKEEERPLNNININKQKIKHREHKNNIFSERPKYLHQNNYFNPTSKKILV